MARATKPMKNSDFIDLGASTGGSILWAGKAFGGNGIGVDMSEEKVEMARKAGREMILADARKLDLADNSVRFCTLLDFLEHLPSLKDADAVIRSAYRVANEFIYIALPNFDNERLLREKDLKRYYTDWSNHTLHLRTGQLQDILSSLGGDYRIYRFNEVFDTWDRSVIPVEAPRNSSFYDPDKRRSRPFALLPRKALYTRTLAVVVKDKKLDADTIMMQAIKTTGYLQELKPPAKLKKAS